MTGHCVQASDNTPGSEMHMPLPIKWSSKTSNCPLSFLMHKTHKCVRTRRHAGSTISRRAMSVTQIPDSLISLSLSFSFSLSLTPTLPQINFKTHPTYPCTLKHATHTPAGARRIQGPHDLCGGCEEPHFGLHHWHSICMSRLEGSVRK
jgi:hypothetical protein